MTDAPLRIGSLCTGYGGLDHAAQEVFGGDLAWVADNDRGASTILAHHYPDAPNLGDITQVDWENVPPVDILTAGSPCQGISNLGHKLGLDDHRSGVWANVADAARTLRPRLIVLENVAAIKARGLDQVVTDLTGAGYRVRWMYLPASAAGAAHPRLRWNCVAELGAGASGPVDFTGNRGNRIPLLPTPKASDGRNGGPNQRDKSGRYYLPGLAVRLNPHWTAHDGTDYRPAIDRWAKVVGRPAPPPTAPNRRNDLRVNPVFVEWLMGLDEGHVTAVPGLDRNQQMNALGNGVVSRQAAYAQRLLRDSAGREVAA